MYSCNPESNVTGILEPWPYRGLGKSTTLGNSTLFQMPEFSRRTLLGSGFPRPVRGEGQKSYLRLSGRRRRKPDTECCTAVPLVRCCWGCVGSGGRVRNGGVHGLPEAE